MVPISCSSLTLSSARHVAAALPDLDLAVEPHVIGQRTDRQIGVHDLDVVVGLDVASGQISLLGDIDPQCARCIRMHPYTEFLDVEDDLGDVLIDSGDGRELVHDSLDLDRGDGGALDGREQHATQTVADGGPEAALEWLDLELAERIGCGLFLELHPGGKLEITPANAHVSVLLCSTWSRARR